MCLLSGFTEEELRGRVKAGHPSAEGRNKMVTPTAHPKTLWNSLSALPTAPSSLGVVLGS